MTNIRYAPTPREQAENFIGGYALYISGLFPHPFSRTPRSRIYGHLAREKLHSQYEEKKQFLEKIKNHQKETVPGEN